VTDADTQQWYVDDGPIRRTEFRFLLEGERVGARQAYDAGLLNHLFEADIEPIVQSTEDHIDAENAVIGKRPSVVRGG